MTCCCPHSRSAGRCFSRFARSYRKRFSRKGFEPSQRQLLEGLATAGYADTDLLEIGCGVGHLHLSLLEQGARRAVGIDLSQKMIEEAGLWAQERHLADRVEYLTGDFMEEKDRIEPADVTVLDKVVCCYPDAYGLVNESLARTHRVYALTYPRNRWYIRWVMEGMALILKLFRSDFRPYVHDPARIETWTRHHGFTKTYEKHTFIWLSQVYIRS